MRLRPDVPAFPALPEHHAVLSAADSTRFPAHVFEGGQGGATLLSRFTVNSVGFTGQLLVPEPSSAMIGALGMFILFRRRR